MAKLSNDKTYVTVEKGDTLSKIAKDYAQYSGNATYQKLASINDISNANLIYIGQKIKLTGDPPKKNGMVSNPKTVTKKQFGLQADVDNTLLAVWEFKRDNTDHYEIKWKIWTADKLWMVSSEAETKYKYATFQIPSNARQVICQIKPVSKTKTEGNKTVYYWSDGEYCSETLFKYRVEDTIAVPPVPTVTMEGFNITASVSNLEDPPSIVQFQLIKNDSETGAKTSDAKVSTGAATVTFKNVAAGGRYKVRCRGKIDGKFGEYSDYSETFTTIPATPGKLTKCEPKSLADPASIYVSWASVDNADEYELQYTTKESYFDTSDKVTSKTGIKETAWEITDIETGKQYFVRVRAKNEKGESGWSPISSTVIGTAPAPPTTWASTNSVVSGEPLTFYWVHNTEDGSSQNGAKIEIYIGNTQLPEVWFDDSDKVNESDKTRSYEFPMLDGDGKPLYSDGTVIRWRVKTVGLANTWSDWSVQREVNVYAPASVELDAPDTVTSLPISVAAQAYPISQTPIGYYISIVAVNGYETVDNVGNPKMVSAGETVFSKHIDPIEGSPYELTTTLSAGEITLKDGAEYILRCSVFMDSGLSGEAEHPFTVEVAQNGILPSAEVFVDDDTLAVSLRPYCATYTSSIHVVSYVDGVYSVTNEVLEYEPFCESDESVGTTPTGEDVYFGLPYESEEGEEVYFCSVVTQTLHNNVLLDVYRREYDGTFTLVADNLEGSMNTFVLDPHPALDYARYRIVATMKDTGTVVYNDITDIKVGCKSVVVQWGEEWTDTEAIDGESLIDGEAWSGSMLKLPYNIDVSNSHDPDVELVEYIGRSHPVSYYGTQKGETATWNVVIDKTDTATLTALRRLAVWPGDAYVREPSGTGYWANVKVSFSQKHNELTIPVTLDITRVEGGA